MASVLKLKLYLLFLNKIQTKHMSKGSGGTGKGGGGNLNGAGTGIAGRSEDKTDAKNGTHDVLPEDNLMEARKKVAELTGMSEDEARESMRAIYGFTQERSVEIRNLQYEGKTSPEIEKINRYIERMPKFKGEILRGKEFNTQKDVDDFIAKMKSGKSYEMPAISSFTSAESTARRFATMRNKYTNGPNNQKIPVVLVASNNKSGASIRNISEVKHENEILVPKGAKYKLKGEPYTKDGVMYVPLQEY